MKKTYCVHVHPRMYEYENIEARSPKEALDRVLRAEWPDSEEVGHIEVMLTCQHCDTNNETENKNCEQCGETL